MLAWSPIHQLDSTDRFFNGPPLIKFGKEQPNSVPVTAKESIQTQGRAKQHISLKSVTGRCTSTGDQRSGMLSTSPEPPPVMTQGPRDPGGAGKRYEGRVTIDGAGLVIGSGGAAIGERMRVEQNGALVGYATRPQFEAAFQKRRPLMFTKLGDADPSNRTYEGRVTVNADDRIIGSGGASVGERMRVERDGQIIGYTTRPQFEGASEERRPLNYRELEN